MGHAPPDEVFGSSVVEVRDVWAVEDRVYCEVRTASNWVATCLLVDTDEWHICHAYRLERGEPWRDALHLAVRREERHLRAVN